MRSMFKGDELNYRQINKHAYTIYKSIKHFRPYLLKSKMKMIVRYAGIRNVLVQKELGEKRTHQMTALQEYDLEIKPSKIVKGQALCLLTAQPNDPVQEQQWIQEEDMSIDTPEVISCEQYDDIRFYLTHGYVKEQNMNQRRLGRAMIPLKKHNYSIIEQPVHVM